MEPKRPNQTPRTGETKHTNQNLLRVMVKNYRNNIITNQLCHKLSNSLPDEEIKELIRWFEQSNREIEFDKQSIKNKRRF